MSAARDMINEIQNRFQALRRLVSGKEDDAANKARQLAAKPPRAMDEIRRDYFQLCAQLGDLADKGRVLDIDAGAIRGKLDALRVETQARQSWDAKEAKASAAPVLRDVSAKE